MITQIILDVDGVVADIHKPILETLGYKYTDWKLGEYWFEKALNPPVATDAVWEHPLIKTESFWADAPKTAWADELYELCKSIAPVCFLTKPVHDSFCASGKMKWFKKHFPKCDFLIGNNKNVCARPNLVLIDDSDSNVIGFINEGGSGIVFPRRWNMMHAEEHRCMEYVRMQLENLK